MPARIVVIEDNPASLELICYLLRAFGHDPQSATDGATGFDLAQREHPDLILCDIQLPVMDGYEVVRRLKGHPMLRMVPIVALTAFAMVGDRDKILAAGFDGYLPKPIVPETFVGQVEAFLGPGHRLSCHLDPDGPAVSGKADPQLSSIPFVLISSADLLRDREQDLPAGAAGLIPRPIEPQVLAAKVEACLRERKEARLGQDPDR
jgi:CheY-like chemotaxis protein